MTTYSSGDSLFCDFPFGGKPKAVCVEVLKPGNGRMDKGSVRVRLTETVGAYKKGEEMILSTFFAVPLKQEFTRGFFRWVKTDYRWE